MTIAVVYFGIAALTWLCITLWDEQMGGVGPLGAIVLGLGWPAVLMVFVGGGLWLCYVAAWSAISGQREDGDG